MEELDICNYNMTDAELLKWQQEQYDDSIYDNQLNRASEAIDFLLFPHKSEYEDEPYFERSAIEEAIRQHGLREYENDDREMMDTSLKETGIIDHCTQHAMSVAMSSQYENDDREMMENSSTIEAEIIDESYFMEEAISVAISSKGLEL